MIIIHNIALHRLRKVNDVESKQEGRKIKEIFHDPFNQAILLSIIHAFADLLVFLPNR